MLRDSIPLSVLSNFLQTDPATGKFFYTFSNVSGSPTDILASNLITYQDPTTPFLSFEPTQRYRLAVRYSECQAFGAPASPILDDVMKKLK